MNLQNTQLDWDELQQERLSVLQQWPTGSEVDIEDGIRYIKALPKTRNFALRMREAKKENLTLTQPRAGVPVATEHLELLQYLEEVGQADLLPTTIDSYTRQNRYEEAQRGLEESRREGRALLNGFPAINHGITNCRRIIDGTKVPVQVRHGTPDARLLAEVTLASGFTAFEGGGISYNIPYAKQVPLEQSIQHWQYVDRLVGYYQEQGAAINREPFGPLTGTLVLPSISHSVGILEALLAAAQGVKHISLGYGQCGNLIQDVAAVAVLEELAHHYLEQAGFADVVITTVFHQWMGGFPADEAKAFGVISLGAAAASLAKATKVIVKTPHEALGIPTKEANAKGLLTTKQVINMLRDQAFPHADKLQLEKDMIQQETKALVDRALDLGEGDAALAAVRAFAAGVIDVPFAPSRMNAGKIMPARDHEGAVRLLNPGNLPFPGSILEFHREALARRGEMEGRQPSFQMVVDDIYAIGKGMLVGRPR